MSNQFRPDVVMPRVLVDELLRLYRLDPNWMQVYRNDHDGYCATWFAPIASRGTCRTRPPSTTCKH
jgi:hypothetical protein